MKNRNEIDFLLNNFKKILFILLFVIFGLLYVTLGFFKIIVIIIFAGIGYCLSYIKYEKIFTLFSKIFKDEKL